ncbi:MAG: hypothetical protein ACQSGP_12245 [Frankia sp.]
MPLSPPRIRSTPSRLVLLFSALFLIACATSIALNQPPNRATPVKLRSSIPPTRSPRGAEAAVILTRYSNFWHVLPRASGSPPGLRQRLLADYLVDPELSRALEAMAAQDALGRVLYGADVPRPVLRRTDGTSAEVVDCQNSSGAGVRDRRSGERVTVGSDHNPVLARLTRGPGGQWRIAQVSYSGGFC